MPHNLNINHHTDGEKLLAAPDTTKQLVATSSVHLFARDFRIAINIHIMKVTKTKIQTMTSHKSRDKRKAMKSKNGAKNK